MATTPEGKVKARIKRILGEAGAYYFMPATHGYGSSGHPDIVACLNGQFIGIECKANGGKPTELQLKRLRELSSCGGVAVLVDETGVEDFKKHLDKGLINGVFITLLRGKYAEEGVGVS